MSLLLLTAACGAMPAAGPSIREFDENAAYAKGLAVVELSPAVLAQLRVARPASLAETFGNSVPAPVRTIESGDVVAVTLWDAGGGLFSPQGPAQPGTQVTTLPIQTVDPDGNITVPFVGEVSVAGKSTFEAQRSIVHGLEHQALKPQALVSIVSDSANFVTVIGDVKSPNQLPLNITGTRLLDAVALAGGPTAPAFDTIVQLNRDGMTRRLRLSSILSRPAENIYLRRADVIYVLRDPEFIVVLGATKSNLRFAFDAEHMSLAELLAQAGGLVDLQAEPTGVFVFRLAPASLVAGMVRRAQPVPNKDAIIPVIFQADLRRPEQLFLAQEFQLENKDIVYVTDAEVVQLDEVLRLILHAAEIVGIAVSRTNVVPIP